MSNTCSVCRHPELAEIDKALVEQVPYRTIAKRFGFPNHVALFRHKDAGHVPMSLTTVQEADREDRARSLLIRVEERTNQLEKILDRAEEQGQASLFLRAARELRPYLELLGKVTGELDDRPQVTVNILKSSEWMKIRAVLLEVLAEHPAAREALAPRLAALESGEQVR